MDLSSILEWYKEEEGRQQIKRFMNERETTFKCYHGLYVCTKCHYLLNNAYLYMKSETRTFTNSYDCLRCNSRMPTKPLLDDVKSGVLDCPDCKQEKLAVTFYMDWD
ncbi:hypothetical protein [Bacillus sp. FJAT-52991]|uniref:Uncharacterized protein n=1 Tax=Bacillus kandeliae TaxID=3129297 RepID=A0ABZ2N1D3_9BACI